MSTVKIKRALLSVSDKAGIVELAAFLAKNGVELFSTGGTYKIIKENAIPVKEVNEMTGFPEMMDGRVKTLHPKVHGGILAVRDNPEHQKQAAEHGIEFLDLVLVNLYPFEKTVANPEVTLEDAIENIDIGGPAMLRSSAKNYKFVTVITDPADYLRLQNEITELGGTSLEFRQSLALKVYARTAAYDAAISTHLSKVLDNNLKMQINLEQGSELRYGENSHQQAWLYRLPGADKSTLAAAELLNGKEMSYNNYLDAQAALEAVREISEPAAVVIKHSNPCGVATGKNLREALERAWYGDPISAMGSVLAFNRPFDMDTLKFLKGKEVKHYSFQVVNNALEAQEIPVGGKFVEVILAPDFTAEALEYLTTKKNSKNIRVIKVDTAKQFLPMQLKTIDGGLLVQSSDDSVFAKFEQVTAKKFNDKMQQLAEFAMICCKSLKSNTITLGRLTADGNYQLLGMGAGQPNRVDSLRKLAVTKARENLELEYKGLQNPALSFEEYYQQVMTEEVVMASDAFFPFDDTVRSAAEYGIKYIVQPGGSMHDEDSIKACDELDIAMAFTGNRHFRH